MNMLRMSAVITIGMVLGMFLLQGAEADEVDDGSVTLAPGEFEEVSFEVFAEVTISIEMSSSTSIDILFMDYSNAINYGFASTEYGSGVFEDYHKDKSKLSTSSADYSFDVPEGKYTVMFDNTNVPAGGAAGASSASVDFYVGLNEDDDGAAGGGAFIFILLIIIVIVIVVVVVVVLRSKGKKKKAAQYGAPGQGPAPPPGPPPQGQGMQDYSSQNLYGPPQQGPPPGQYPRY